MNIIDAFSEEITNPLGDYNGDHDGQTKGDANDAIEAGASTDEGKLARIDSRLIREKMT